MSAPVDLGRDEAQERALAELLDPIYAQNEPSVWERIYAWVWERFTDLFDLVTGAGGTTWWLLVLLVIVALIVTAIVHRTGGLQRRRQAQTRLFAQTTTTAADHRAAAETAARDADWATAVVESFRAIVRQVEERGLLAPSAGRTADEAARNTAQLFPHLSDDITGAVRTFDDIAYGGRRASPDAYRAMRELDEHVRATRPQPAATAVELSAPR